ncbi:patatin family protein [Arcanobacterium haemolyticum]|nr:patatin family protein [Arcanobacterium haemolyticum]
MTTTHPHNQTLPTALVFEGGGMRGAYTAALAATMIEAGIEFPWVGGISAGATNTSNMISRDAWRARAAYVELARDPRTGGPISFIRGHGYFNSDFIYRHTPHADEAIPFDWEGYVASQTPYRIGAFNCETGQTVYWGRDDVTDLDDFALRCQASASMPILMPITDVHGVPYLDGAIGSTGGFAIDAAEDDGFERFVVVMTRERGYRKPPMRMPRALYRRIFRRYPKVADAILARPAHYNATLDRLEQLEREGRAYLYYPDTMPIANGERDPLKVEACYNLGLRQAERDLPKILDFVNGK